MRAENPNDLFQRGTRLLEANQLAGAEQLLRRALALRPAQPEIHANLALVMEGRGENEAAERHYRQGLAGAPDNAQLRCNYATLLAQQDRLGEAEDLYREALELDPDAAHTWNNLGTLLARARRVDEAEECLRVAMLVQPGYRRAAFNLGCLLLSQGRFQEGWQRLEARDSYLDLERRLPMPRWRGEPLRGKSLLLGFEQGCGDMIQFGRYISRLRGLGIKRLDMVCHPPLVALFATHPGLDSVVGYDHELPNLTWDYWTPPLSLPLRFGTRLDDIPATIPYLSAAPERTRHWRQRLQRRPGALRVGLVWKGNPRFEHDRYRSLPNLAILSPLGTIPGIDYYSLQKGAGEEELKPAPFPIEPLGAELRDFADTAAALTHLDLLISVDSAPAHLCAALGRPCWLLLSDIHTDWRWLQQRDDSPWYPQVMRLFRRPEGADWATTVQQLASELRDLATLPGQA